MLRALLRFPVSSIHSLRSGMHPIFEKMFLVSYPLDEGLVSRTTEALRLREDYCAKQSNYLYNYYLFVLAIGCRPR